jgi:hypothetical protein
MADFSQSPNQQQDPDAIKRALLAKLFGGTPGAGLPPTPGAPGTAQPTPDATVATTATGQPVNLTPTAPAAKPMTAAPGSTPAKPIATPSTALEPGNQAPILSEADYAKQNPAGPHTPYQAPDLKHRMLEGLFAGMQEFGRPGEGAATVRDYLGNIQKNEHADSAYKDNAAAAAHSKYMTYVAGARAPIDLENLNAELDNRRAEAEKRRAEAAALADPQPKYQRAFIEDPEHPGQGKHADFDQRSGQFIDPDTQKIIPGAKPYAKPEREAGTIPADIEARLGPKPKADAANPGGAVQWNGKSYATEHAAQAAWGSAVAKAIDDHARAAGEARGAGFAQSKLMNVLRNGTVMAIHPDEMQPGDVLSGASAGEHAMTRGAQIDDIRNSMQNVKETAKVLDSGRIDRAKLATALADPQATLASFAQSEVRNQLNPDEENYVIAVLNAREQIAGLRSLLGAGQVSDARMKLMLQTIPGAATGNSEFAGKQVDRALKDLELLAKGVPKMPAAGGKDAAAATTAAPKYEHTATDGHGNKVGWDGTKWVEIPKQQ